jgi:orotidine-5'-phosphate decarboxylase
VAQVSELARPEGVTPTAIVALDLPSADAALAMVDRLGESCDFYKVGNELFTAAGPDVVRALRDRGVDVFLDLKLHDIGNTVAAAVRRACDLDVRFLTLHASGGPAMLQAAAQAATSTTTLLAVTALTSLSDEELVRSGHVGGAVTLVPQLARLARDCGIGGVVCSPLEIEAVKRLTPELRLVTPGVRSAADDKDDQARVLPAEEAVARGADVVVVGRPIRTAPDRKAAAQRFVDEIRRGRARRTA